LLFGTDLVVWSLTRFHKRKCIIKAYIATSIRHMDSWTTIKPTPDLRPVPKDEATGPNVWAHDCTHRIVNKERLPNSQPDRPSPLREEILTLFCFVGVRSVKRAIRSLGVSQRRAETQGSVSLYHRRREFIEPIMFTQCSYSAALIGCQNS
jgi:hypothetical protein